MSDFRAIAGVSRSLRNLLRDRMQDPVPVTLAPPDVALPDVNSRRLNLYLYQVTENAFLKNQDDPGEGHPGAYGRPPLRLNLHYLATAFPVSETSEDADLDAQQILGDAMRVLHDFAVVADSLQITRAAVGVVGSPILDSSLWNEFEQVKLSFQATSVEDLSKLWTALPKANFRRSVGYEAAVIKIQTRRPANAPLPVRERLVLALPFRSPKIVDVSREPPLDGLRVPIAEVGETLRVRGANLAGDNVRVQMRDQSVVPVAVRDDQVDAVVPAALAAGVHAIQVVHDLRLGRPAVAHRGFRSNALAFEVIPHINSITPPGAAAGAAVTVTLTPPIRVDQEITLLLDDFEVPPIVPSPPPPPDTPPTASVQFRLPTSPAPTVPPGAHLVRVRVDGAESRLTVDPVTGQFTGPTYTVA